MGIVGEVAVYVGYDLEELKRYYGKLSEDAEWRGTFGWTEELGKEWEQAGEYPNRF